MKIDSRAFRNRYWSFRIEQKVFVLFLSKDGMSIRISERTRLASFDLDLEVSAAVWCLELFKEVSYFDGKKIFKKFRGSSFVVLAESYENRRGTFMKITKIFRGFVKNLVVSCGWNGWGWKQFANCLDNLVGKRFWEKGGLGVTEQNRRWKVKQPEGNIIEGKKFWQLIGMGQREESKRWKEGDIPVSTKNGTNMSDNSFKRRGMFSENNLAESHIRD